MLKSCLIEERQVAGEDEPRDVRILRLSRHDARGRPQVLVAVDNLGKACAHRIVHLIRAYGHECACHERGYEPHSLCQLRAAAVVQRRLVGAHARAAAAGEYQAIDGCAHRRFTLRLPPDFSSRRTLVICISWESALHMSYTVSAATVAPVSASISTPVR